MAYRKQHREGTSNIYGILLETSPLRDYVPCGIYLCVSDLIYFGKYSAMKPFPWVNCAVCWLRPPLHWWPIVSVSLLPVAPHRPRVCIFDLCFLAVEQTYG